VLPIVN